MPPKRNKNRESTPNVTSNVLPDIRSHLNPELSRKMSLRSDESENVDNFDDMVSENSAVLDSQQDVTCEMSTSELAKMMKDKFKESLKISKYRVRKLTPLRRRSTQG